MAQAVVQCPVEEAIQIIGGKWKLLVLRSLLLNGPQRYNQLLGTVTAISQKELTRNLRELTDAGLVARDSGTSRTAEYDLTKLGKASCRHSRNC
jgi:DNA-binding HxlR family transcriptional regulator